MSLAAAVSPEPRELALQARGLTRRFGGVVAVNGVDLDVAAGTVHALIGPNGAGKTTLFNLLTRFLDVSEGEISLFGRDITRMPAADVARVGLVRSFQISALFDNLTALQNVRIALQRRVRSDCFDFWRSSRVLAPLNDEAMALLESVDLADFRNVRAGELAYGRKRSLELATTLALDPRVLLLDEPTAGMAPEDIDRIVALIAQVARTRTVLMVEHNLSVVSTLSNRITVLHRGQVLVEGDYAHVAGHPAVIEAYIGADDD